MKIEQLYTGCLAQGAYYIESNGQAAIIDPLREVQAYIDLANERDAQISYIFETHFHADFVSGHITLSEKTGAPIIFGPKANPSFDCTVAKDNQEFKLGNVIIRVLHTPGHTIESTTYLLIDENGVEHAIFSGDTLFLGDVGRPDLAQKATHLTQEQLAGMLFHSLRTKIMPLPDHTIVYPGHGAGSACGKHMSKETIGTLGDQKATNYALRANMTEQEFIDEVTDGLLAPPAYFPANVKLNKEGYENVEDVLKKGLKPISSTQVEALTKQQAIVLDVRHQSAFAKAHIPNSIFIGLDGSFAPWVGSVIADIQQAIILVVEKNRLKEAITRLSRVGFDNVIGFVDGGVEAWINDGYKTSAIETIDAESFAHLNKNNKLSVYDVRKPGEFETEHIINAKHTPLSNLFDHLKEFDASDKNYIHCAGGYRSMIANSILKKSGIHNVVDVLGGFAKIKQTNIETIEFNCSST